MEAWDTVALITIQVIMEVVMVGHSWSWVSDCVHSLVSLFDSPIGLDFPTGGYGGYGRYGRYSPYYGGGYGGGYAYDE